jgi:hypothetical protein
MRRVSIFDLRLGRIARELSFATQVLSLTPRFSGVILSRWRAHEPLQRFAQQRQKPLKRFEFCRALHTPLKRGVNGNRGFTVLQFRTVGDAP